MMKTALTAGVMLAALSNASIAKSIAIKNPGTVITKQEYLFIGVRPFKIDKKDKLEDIEGQFQNNLEEVRNCYERDGDSEKAGGTEKGSGTADFDLDKKTHLFRTHYFKKTSPGFVVTAFGPFDLMKAEGVLYKLQDCLGDFMVPLFRKERWVYALVPKVTRPLHPPSP